MLCSVFEALRKRPQHERSGGETREVVECFSLRLECSRQFLRPLRQNRTQSRLLHLFYDKESIKSPTHYFLIFKTTGRMTALCFLHSMAYVISYHAQFLQMLTGNRRELSRATWRSYVTVILVSKWGLFLTSSVFLFQRRYRIKLHKVYVFKKCTALF